MTAAVLATVLEIAALLLPVLLQCLETKPTKEVQDRVDSMRKTLATNDGRAFAAAAASQHDRVRLAVQEYLPTGTGAGGH